MRRVAMVMALSAALATWACGARGGDEQTAVSTSTTQAVRHVSTTIQPSETTDKAAAAGSRQSTTTEPASTALESSAETEVVDSGRAPTGEWQLQAERQAGDLLCAVLKMDGQDQGQVCNEASEQDFNGDEVLRYAVLGDGTFVVGVSASHVDKVRAELRDGTMVERATVGASFADSRLVALPLPAPSVISTLVAVDDNGQVLTRFALNS